MTHLQLMSLYRPEPPPPPHYHMPMACLPRSITLTLHLHVLVQRPLHPQNLHYHRRRHLLPGPWQLRQDVLLVIVPSAYMDHTLIHPLS
jgi:hypothetical protein